MRPWTDYFQKHKETLDLLNSVYPDPQAHLFESKAFVQGVSERIASKKIGSHADLESFIRNIYEAPMELIMKQLHSMPEVCREFLIPNQFEFRNNGNGLSDGSLENAISTKQTPPQPSTPPQACNSPEIDDASKRPSRPDQFCAYTTDQGEKKILLTAEFKPPHKLSLDQLRLILGPDCPPIDLDEIINQIKMPSYHEKEASRQDRAKREVAAVITQAFSYMVTTEVQYGYICTGEALVFLHIKLEDDMKTVYYYLLEPDKEDLSANELQQHNQVVPLADLKNTALSHILTFSIKVFVAARKDDPWRARIVPGLRTWTRDEQAMLAKLTPTPTTAGKSSVDYKPNTDPDSDSPTKRHQNRRKRPRRDCEPTIQPTSQNRPDSPPAPDDGSSGSRPVTRTATARAKQSQQSQSSANVSSYTMKHTQRSYCTQRCLQGLTRGGPLDPRCPNVSKHCEEGYKGNTHQLSCEEFRVLLEQQMRRCYGEDFYPLGKQGARGALFKVRLDSHAYTIVAKGTIWPFVRCLRHEAEVYRRLACIQGIHVPVFLGSIDLDYDFYYAAGDLIVHMMLLSWCGEGLRSDTLTDTEKQTRSLDIMRAVTAIHEAGVLHRDIRIQNLLWNEELKQPMVIDFERVDIVKALTRPALLSMSSNKKRKRSPNQEENVQKKDDKINDEKEKDDGFSVAAIMRKHRLSKHLASLDMMTAWNMLS